MQTKTLFLMILVVMSVLYTSPIQTHAQGKFSSTPSDVRESLIENATKLALSIKAKNKELAFAMNVSHYAANELYKKLANQNPAKFSTTLFFWLKSSKEIYRIYWTNLPIDKKSEVQKISEFKLNDESKDMKTFELIFMSDKTKPENVEKFMKTLFNENDSFVKASFDVDFKGSKNICSPSILQIAHDYFLESYKKADCTTHLNKVLQKKYKDLNKDKKRELKEYVNNENLPNGDDYNKLVDVENPRIKGVAYALVNLQIDNKPLGSEVTEFSEVKRGDCVQYWWITMTVKDKNGEDKNIWEGHAATITHATYSKEVDDKGQIIEKLTVVLFGSHKSLGKTGYRVNTFEKIDGKCEKRFYPVHPN